jgi:phage terminase large subunit-like protein
MGKRLSLVNWLPINKQVDKVSHLTSKTPWFTTGSIVFNPELTDLMDHLATFPDGEDDDVDGLLLSLDNVDFVGSSQMRALEMDVQSLAGISLGV